MANLPRCVCSPEKREQCPVCRLAATVAATSISISTKELQQRDERDKQESREQDIIEQTHEKNIEAEEQMVVAVTEVQAEEKGSVKVDAGLEDKAGKVQSKTETENLQVKVKEQQKKKNKKKKK